MFSCVQASGSPVRWSALATSFCCTSYSLVDKYIRIFDPPDSSLSSTFRSHQRTGPRVSRTKFSILWLWLTLVTVQRIQHQFLPSLWFPILIFSALWNSSFPVLENGAGYSCRTCKQLPVQDRKQRQKGEGVWLRGLNLPQFWFVCEADVIGKYVLNRLLKTDTLIEATAHHAIRRRTKQTWYDGGLLSSAFIPSIR